MEFPMNYIAQRDVLKQLGISISTLKRWQKHRGFPGHISVSDSVKIFDQSAIENWLKSNRS